MRSHRYSLGYHDRRYQGTHKCTHAVDAMKDACPHQRLVEGSEVGVAQSELVCSSSVSN